MILKQMKIKNSRKLNQNKFLYIQTLVLRLVKTKQKIGLGNSTCYLFTYRYKKKQCTSAYQNFNTRLFNIIEIFQLCE